MLNSRLRILFIHPPKTGGWSVCGTLQNNGITPQHHSVHFYRKMNFNFDDHFVFTTTRNPWARLVSAWTFFREELEPRVSKDLSFEDYIVCHQKVCFSHANANPRWLYPGQVLDWITWQGEISVDYICNLHTFEGDFDMIRRFLGPIPLPHLNPSRHDEYQTYYNEKTRDIVTELYKDDIRYFGFDFDDESKCNFERIVNREKIERLLRTEELRKKNESPSSIRIY